LRLIDSCITQLLGPVTRVKKKKKTCVGARASSSVGALLLLDEDSATKQHAIATAVDTVRKTSLHGG